MKKYIAEFIGVFILSIAVLASSAISAPAALVAGLALIMIVAVIGNISGAHVNPAMTLSIWSLRKISWQDALFYILAQFAGAALATIVAHVFQINVALPTTLSWVTFGAEVIGAAIFAFGVASVVLKLENQRYAPLTVGGSLALGSIVAAALGSHGILNPAVAFGIGSFGVSYVFGPIVGALIGMWAYKAISAPVYSSVAAAACPLCGTTTCGGTCAVAGHGSTCTCKGTDYQTCGDGKNPQKCGVCNTCKVGK